MRNIYTKLQILNLIALCTLKKKKRKQEVTETENSYCNEKITHLREQK